MNTLRKYNLNFTLIATPAEGLSGRFVGIDKALYGKIKGVTDRALLYKLFPCSCLLQYKYYQIKYKQEAPYHYLTNGWTYFLYRIRW